MARRGKGGLKKNLDPSTGKGQSANTMNGGKGQEITGVSLPDDGEWMCTLLGLKEQFIWNSSTD